jgi:hypothetical protein
MTQVGRDAVRSEMRTLMGYSYLEFINRFHLLSNNFDGYKIVDTFLNMLKVFDLLADSKDIKQFAKGNKYINEKQLFKWIIDGKEAEKGENRNSISYTTRIQEYAYYGYLLVNNDLNCNEQMVNWFRVISTLSRETNYNGADDYVRAIKGVSKLLPHSSDILTFLSTIDDTKGYGFDIDCFEEECIKAILILKSDKWKKLVLDAESNPYFNGQIGFLLEFSKIDEAYKDKSIQNWDACTNVSFMESFSKFKNIMCSIFGAFTSNKNNYVGLNREYISEKPGFAWLFLQHA